MSRPHLTLSHAAVLTHVRGRLGRCAGPALRGPSRLRQRDGRAVWSDCSAPIPWTAQCICEITASASPQILKGLITCGLIAKGRQMQNMAFYRLLSKPATFGNADTQGTKLGRPGGQLSRTVQPRGAEALSSHRRQLPPRSSSRPGEPWV